MRQKIGNTITSSPLYTDEEVKFMLALDTYKRTNKRPYPTWIEVLAVAHSLGYRKVEPTTPLPTYVKGLQKLEDR